MLVSLVRNWAGGGGGGVGLCRAYVSSAAKDVTASYG